MRQLAFCGLTLWLAACGDDLGVEVLAGGSTTVYDRSSNAYRLPAPNLTAEELALHLDGDVAFEASFVSGSAPVNGGLGPLFNNTSCIACHNRDGRGRPVISSTTPSSVSLVRVSFADGTGEPEVPGGSVPYPGVGTQFRNHAIFGATPDAAIELTWSEEAGSFADGEMFALRRPVLDISIAGVPLAANVATSLRMPPPVFGLGLLEVVDEQTLLALADPDDSNGDGISGRINRVWDPVTASAQVGRFGLKANVASLRGQTGGAYAGDMGISSPLHPEASGESDISEATLTAATFYVQTLGVPASLPLDTQSARGQQLFASFGCASCHTPVLTTGASNVAALAYQDIAPYTDLLLHDMGPGLADGRRDFLATGSEWRTPPLWGLGLVQTVLPGGTYLHDGRARTLEEAVLWHGGESADSSARFKAASAADRDALIAFLRSL